MTAETTTPAPEKETPASTAEVIAYRPSGARTKIIARGISVASFSAAAIWFLAISGSFDTVGLVLLGIAGALFSVGFARSTARRLENNTLHLKPADSTYRFGDEGEWRNIRDLKWRSITFTPPAVLASHAYVARSTLVVEDDKNLTLLQDTHDTLGKNPWRKQQREGMEWLASKSLGRSDKEKAALDSFVKAMNSAAGEWTTEEEDEEETNG